VSRSCPPIVGWAGEIQGLTSADGAPRAPDRDSSRESAPYISLEQSDSSVCARSQNPKRFAVGNPTFAKDARMGHPRSGRSGRGKGWARFPAVPAAVSKQSTSRARFRRGYFATLAADISALGSKPLARNGLRLICFKEFFHRRSCRNTLTNRTCVPAGTFRQPELRVIGERPASSCGSGLPMSSCVREKVCLSEIGKRKGSFL